MESPDRYTLGGSYWGLGVILFDWDGHRLYGHDGSTIGQASMLRILPEADIAMCLLVNGGDVEPVYRTIFGELASELAGIAMPPPLEAPATPPALDLDRYAGSFERLVPPLRPRRRGRSPRRHGDAERAARLDGSRPGDEADASRPSMRRRSSSTRRGRADAWTGGVLRVRGRRSAVLPPWRPGQPPRRLRRRADDWSVSTTDRRRIWRLPRFAASLGTPSLAPYQGLPRAVVGGGGDEREASRPVAGAR